MAAQFLRLYGYPKGQQSAANTMGSVIAEGLRKATHIGHLTQPPQIEVFTNPNSPIEHPEQLGAWINEQMSRCRYGQGGHYPKGRPLRKNAVALGTFITSLPQRSEDVSQDLIYDFRERSHAWFNQWLEERQMLLHTSILHLDEAYPHVHAWFTPNLDLIEQGKWPLGEVTFPQRAVLKKLQVDFFEEVGQHFYSQRVKPKSQRRKRLDRRTAIKLRDMPETLTSHPIHDLGFFNAAYALAKYSETRSAEQQANIMDAIKEVLDMEAGMSNREALMELIAEHRELNKERVLQAGEHARGKG